MPSVFTIDSQVSFIASIYYYFIMITSRLDF